MGTSASSAAYDQWTEPSYEVKVRGTMHLWGSAGITKDISFDKQVLLHIHNDLFGEVITGHNTQTEDSRSFLASRRSSMHRYRHVLLLMLFLLVAQVSAQTPPAAIDHFKDGNKKLQKGDLNGAIAEFSSAIEISSRLEPNRSASRRDQTNRFENSAGDPSGITVIDPFTADAYTNRGLARYRQGDVDGAIQDWDRAIMINPGLAVVYLDRGCARYSKGDKAGALSDWNQALAFNPRLATAYSNRGAARQELGDNEGALADFNKALALNTHHLSTYCLRGDTWLDKGDWRRAISDFNSAIKLDPLMALAYQKRGHAKMALNELSAAIADFNRALGLDPRMAEAYANRGLTLFMQGQDNEAKKDFARALALKPGIRADLEAHIKVAEQLRSGFKSGSLPLKHYLADARRRVAGSLNTTYQTPVGTNSTVGEAKVAGELADRHFSECQLPKLVCGSHKSHAETVRPASR